MINGLDSKSKGKQANSKVYFLLDQDNQCKKEFILAYGSGGIRVQHDRET